MELFLNRSGARPLEVCGHPLAGTAVASLELLYISGVHGDSPDNYPADWVPQLFAGSIQAPRLRRLCLSRILLVFTPRFDNSTVLTTSPETRLPAVLEVVSCHPDLPDLLFSRGLGTVGFSIWSISQPRLSLHLLRRSCVQQVFPATSIPLPPCFPLHSPSAFDFWCPKSRARFYARPRL